MKLKTLIKRIEVLVEEKKISDEKALQCKTILYQICEDRWEKHHLTGAKDGTINNTLKIKGALHYMLHNYAYKFIVDLGLLKKYLIWLKETFGASIDNVLTKIEED